MFEMKVCIVTVYNSINSGSYWQARTLAAYFEAKGDEVLFYPRPADRDSSNSVAFRAKMIAKMMIKGRVTSAVRTYKMYKAFDRCQGAFHVLSGKPDCVKHIDLFVLGSDTIWNFESRYFVNHRELFWGGKFDGRPVIAYAGSAANCSAEDFRPYPELKEMAGQWMSIGVRDQRTKNVLGKMTDQEVVMTCDPTFLFTKNDYANWIPPVREQPFIFLYVFRDLPVSEAAWIRAYAREHGLKIISGIDREDISDRVLVNAPETFVRYMLAADYVITDTFHGTAFSMNFEKRFVVIDRGKEKVTELLRQYGFLDRLSGNEDQFARILDTPIDYSVRRQGIAESRKKSMDFLDNARKAAQEYFK